MTPKFHAERWMMDGTELLTTPVTVRLVGPRSYVVYLGNAAITKRREVIDDPPKRFGELEQVFVHPTLFEALHLAQQVAEVVLPRKKAG